MASVTQRIDDLIEVFAKSKGPLTSLQIIEKLSKRGYGPIEARKLISEAVRAGVLRKVESKAKEAFELASKGEVEADRS